jgi:hypothetical protein
MSTTPFPGPCPTTMAHILVHHITTPVAARRTRPASDVVRRRPTMQQGRALETLGHAIEYLVDSQLHLDPGPASRDDGEAGQILMRLSREVFAECREVVPAPRGLGLRLFHLLAGGHAV